MFTIFRSKRPEAFLPSLKSSRASERRRISALPLRELGFLNAHARLQLMGLFSITEPAYLTAAASILTVGELTANAGRLGTDEY